jgi:hypothetical protein
MKQEPTYLGFIETVDDAAIISNACLSGHLNSITQRYNYEERPVEPGDCFVFIDKKSTVKRWTDGRMWSASRYLGNFLVYRELEGNKQLSKAKENGLLKKTISVELRGWKCHVVCYYTEDHSFHTPTRDERLPLLLDDYTLITNSTTPGTSRTNITAKRSTGAKRKRGESVVCVSTPQTCHMDFPQLTSFPDDYFILE